MKSREDNKFFGWMNQLNKKNNHHVKGNAANPGHMNQMHFP